MQGLQWPVAVGGGGESGERDRVIRCLEPCCRPRLPPTAAAVAAKAKAIAEEAKGDDEEKVVDGLWGGEEAMCGRLGRRGRRLTQRPPASGRQPTTTYPHDGVAAHKAALFRVEVVGRQQARVAEAGDTGWRWVVRIRRRQPRTHACTHTHSCAQACARARGLLGDRGLRGECERGQCVPSFVRLTPWSAPL